MKINTLVEIEKILSEYFKHGSTQSIDHLLETQDRLAIHSYRLAEMAGVFQTDYNQSIFIRKINVNRQTMNIIKAKKLSKAQAQLEADLDNENLFEDELNKQGQAYTADLLLGQVNRVLSAIQQRISYLKTEKEYHKHLK